MNVREEFRRPVSLGLASLALIGWILAVSVLALYSSRLVKVQKLLGDARAQASDLSRDLQTERNAAGTLAELETKVATARQLLAAATRDRDTTGSALVQLQKQIAEARLQLSADRDSLTDLHGREELAKASAALAETGLDQLRAQLKQEREQDSALKAAIETARLEQDARSKALVALDRQLGQAKARLEKLVGDDAAAQKQLNEHRAQLTPLTDQLGKARGELDALNRQLESARKAAAATPPPPVDAKAPPVPAPKSAGGAPQTAPGPANAAKP